MATETESRLRHEAFDASTRTSLPAICWAVSAMLLGRCAFHASFPVGNWMDHTLPLLVTAAATAAFLAGYGTWLSRRRVAGWSADNLVLLPYLLVLATSLVPVALDPRPFRYVTIAFCAVGAGCVFHSRRHLAFAIACCLGSWLVCTASLWEDPWWIRLTSVLFGSFPLAVLIAEIRRASLMRLARLNQVAEESRRQAEEANRAKTRFLANTSHELRTPLAAILGYTELLADESSSAEAVDPSSVARSIDRNARHLLALVNDTLDLSRIESGQIDVEHRPTSPVDLANEAIAIVEVDARRKGLELRLDSTDDVPAGVLTDPTRVRQVLVNLLGNAVKFTHEGRVVLRIGASEGRLEFEVSDTGIGIPEWKREEIFDPFRQADTSTTREYGGTGLGLAISRRFAEALGGGLAVESVPGGGSTFRLELPLDLCEPVDPPAPRSESAGTPLVGRRVLLAEDSPEIALLTALFLCKAGAEVEAVENGRDAVDRVLADAEPFDVVLMDLQMPVLDGYDATAELRSRGHVGPIVALTANAFHEDRRRCVEIGFDDYATKPISRKRLVDLVASRARGETPVSRV